MARKQNSRMGRPPLKAKERRSKVFTIRFTQDEYRDLMRDAKAEGVTVTELLRQYWKKMRG